MFMAGAFIVHQYMGVEDSELFIKDIAAQAQNPMAALLLQGLGSGFGAFLLPSIMFAVLAGGNVQHYLKLDRLPDAKQLLLAIGITITAGVFLALLVELNGKIKLPESLKMLETMQEKYEQLIAAFFKDVSFGRYLLLVLVLAVLPALGEEFFFRGLVQRVLTQSALGVHGAIIFTAIAFAVMHFEFYNLFGILWMGILLGYLYHYTQSLWTSIIAHFLNNFLQVTLKYLYEVGLLQIDVMTVETLPLYYTLSAGVLMFVLLWLLNKNKTQAFPEEAVVNTQITTHE